VVNPWYNLLNGCAEKVPPKTGFGVKKVPPTPPPEKCVRKVPPWGSYAQKSGG